MPTLNRNVVYPRRENLKLNKYLVTMLVVVIVSGCTDKSAVEAAAPAKIVAPVSVIDHYYSLKDGFEYGYEPAVSLDAQNAGQVAGTLMMFKFAGESNGFYQAYNKDTSGAITVAECANPCEFIKVMVFYNGVHVNTERMRATDGTIGWLVMSDAINGKLEQYQMDKNGKKYSVWFDEKMGLKTTVMAQIE